MNITSYKSLNNEVYEDKNKDQDFKLSDFKHSEFELDEIVEAEVINTNCVYFGETAWITHKAYSLDTAWYKAELGYEPAAFDGVQVWLKEDEIEFV